MQETDSVNLLLHETLKLIDESIARIVDIMEINELPAALVDELDRIADELEEQELRLQETLDSTFSRVSIDEIRLNEFLAGQDPLYGGMKDE